MKKRYLYSLLFGIPGFFLSLIIAGVVLGVTMGFLWLFVFGDSPWPFPEGTVLSILLITTFLIAWFTFIIIGFITGKKLERDQVLNKKYVWVSTGLTLAFILIIILPMLISVNFGQKTDLELCNDFCSQKGYGLSWTSPGDAGERNCVCGNNFSKEDIKVPMDSIKGK